MSRGHCRKPVEQLVPKGHSHKIVTMKCGDTGIYGDPLYCPECNAKWDARKYLPYECKHGVDMRPEGAFCSSCEYGDDEEEPTRVCVKTVDGWEWQVQGEER